MATAGEQLKDKKKGRFRGRFLLSQTASLDAVNSSATEAGDPSRTLNNSSDTLSGCSRMRRILFRRTRSDSDDRMRNADRVSKADSVANAALESAHPRLTYPVPPTVLEEGSAASAPVSALSRLHSVMPNSPPPPYDTNPESDSSVPPLTPTPATACPPTYDEAMAQNGSEDVDNQQDLSAMGSALPAGYCNCRECQTRYYDEEEEAEDNCADAVFPMETHVLMQEVLADGMAFCSLM